MDCDEASAAPVRGYVRFSATVAREVCRRVAAGESQNAICAEPAMPSRTALRRWARESAGFARIFARAKAMAMRKPVSGRGYCPATAEEIVARVSEGEMLTSITTDPVMPSLRTVMRWRADHPEFAEDLRLAREALAERFSDMGWKMAMEATPETAFLTQVRLKQLRWTAAVLGPRTHGRLKATEPPKAQERDEYLFSHFKIEVHPENGQHRVVTYAPDPDTNLQIRIREGPWTEPVDPLKKAADLDALIQSRRAALNRLADGSDD